MSPRNSITLRNQEVRAQRHSPRQQHGEEHQGQQAYADVLPEEPDLTQQRLNDSGNAERFVAMYGQNLHYVPELRKWLIWDGRRWRADNINQIQRLAKLAMKAFLWQACDTDNREIRHFAEQSLNVVRLRHLLEAAQSEPGIPVELGHLDRHPLLLNATNGTINLATGELQNHRREDLLTRLVHVDYDLGAQCPRWIAFLNEILEPELIAYLQKLLGYCLSGEVSEKAIFIAFGRTNAGKTTMLSTFRGLISEYSTLLQIQTLTGPARSSNALADLADLRGARFAQTSECGSDERLAQRVLKAVVQGAGGRIKATRKYENPIEFAETAKICIDTNPLPELPDPYDEATLLRLHPIPFAKSIPPDRIDKNLGQKLMAELPGILAWLVEGFRLYSLQGIDKPPAVAAALAACANSATTSLASSVTAVFWVRASLSSRRCFTKRIRAGVNQCWKSQ
jgi:putative DNA primase/helicase